MKHPLLRCLAFGSLLVSMLLVQADSAPKPAIEVIQETATDVIERIRGDKQKLDENPETVYGLVDELIIPHFDFTSMSKWVLGKKYWTAATEQQRIDFIDQFKTLLVRTYAKALLQYSEQKINYLSEKSTQRSNLVEVLTEVEQDGSNPIPINYRMHISGGTWRVVDVVVNGASLVRTYRGEFSSHIRKHGMDDLINKLQERNSASL